MADSDVPIPAASRDTYVTPLVMKCGAITDAAHLPKDVWFYKNGAGRICV